MVKKKFSGQAVAIVILIVLLILTVAFGGVFAFYSASSGRVSSSGLIMMASLDIDFKEDVFEAGKSTESQILITNMNNKLVPSEVLGNSPLTVINNSADEEGRVVPIYVVVLYRVQKATLEENRHLDDIYLTEMKKDQITGEMKKVFKTDKDGKKIPFGVIDIGTDSETSIWTDFVFDTSNYPEYAQDNLETNDNYVVRCFVTKEAQTTKEIPVIKQNNLRLHEEMTNDFQGQSITFTFQAHAISSNQNIFEGLDENATQEERSAAIVKAIYKSNAWQFDI